MFLSGGSKAICRIICAEEGEPGNEANIVTCVNLNYPHPVKLQRTNQVRRSAYRSRRFKYRPEPSAFLITANQAPKNRQ